MVKCKDCGYLSLRDFDNRQLSEIESGIRATGEIPVRLRHREGAVPLYVQTLICFKRQFNLWSEHKDSGLSAAKLLEIISRDRDCPAFTTWKQGFTPKEHEEMALSERMLEIQRQREDADRQWHREESQRQRDWEAAQAKLADERHNDNMRIAVSSNKGNVWSNLIAGAIAALATLGAVYVAPMLQKPAPQSQAETPVLTNKAQPSDQPK